MKIAVSFGGGTNSTALLVGLYEKGIKPDWITFADTGGEKPHTYKHIKEVKRWCKRVGFPDITIVKKVDKEGEILTLEERCISQKMLPSLAYGFKSCSQKFKIQPQDKFFNNNEEAKEQWKTGKKIIKCIGYDAGERRRVKYPEDKKYEFWYPLVEWGWDRLECKKAIERAGLKQPGKSSCFFCPASTKPEIRQLRNDYPELYGRAIAMEKNAEETLHTVKGLGRRFSWKDVIATDDLFPECYIDLACGCYDG